MSTWKILEWSRERGCGAIYALHYDRVEFDASNADVDDFVLDETVHVEVERARSGLRVRRVWPDVRRLSAPVGVSGAGVLPAGALGERVAG